jgi:hypothetical protein
MCIAALTVLLFQRQQRPEDVSTGTGQQNFDSKVLTLSWGQQLFIVAASDVQTTQRRERVEVKLTNHSESSSATKAIGTNATEFTICEVFRKVFRRVTPFLLQLAQPLASVRHATPCANNEQMSQLHIPSNCLACKQQTFRHGVKLMQHEDTPAHSVPGTSMKDC